MTSSAAGRASLAALAGTTMGATNGMKVDATANVESGSSATEIERPSSATVSPYRLLRPSSSSIPFRYPSKGAGKRMRR